MACVSETEYQFCVNNIPSGTGANCPTGYVCSTATDVICVPNVVGNEATCNECNQCDANLVFACTGVNTYALCLGTNNPTADIHTCPSGQVCNINSPQICSPEGTVSFSLIYKDEIFITVYFLRYLLHALAPQLQNRLLLHLHRFFHQPFQLIPNIFVMLCVKIKDFKFPQNLITPVKGTRNYSMILITN